MTFALGATWTSHPGHEDQVARVLHELTPATRAEPGNRFYLATRSVDNPSVFYLFEVYDDEAAYTAHTESEHFTRLVRQDAIPNHLASRERAFYEPLGDLT